PRAAPNLGEEQEAVVQAGAVAELLVGERVRAVAPVEAGRAGRLPLADAAEERLGGVVEPGEHVLQELAVARRRPRPRRAEVLQFGFLPVARGGDAAPLPCRLALLQCGVVAPAAEQQDKLELPLLVGSGLALVLEGLA